MIRRCGHGSWTGQNNPVVKDEAGNVIGYNKLLTFYEDSDDKKGKQGKKNVNNDIRHGQGHWIMHEYSLVGFDKYVLCKITKEIRVNTEASVVLCPDEAAATTPELPEDAICGQTDRACAGLDGAGNDAIIILDDSGSGVQDVQDFLTVDPARIEVINANSQADNNMEGNKQILDEFWNFGLDHDVSPTDTAWDGLDDVLLDFSSPDLFDIWPGDEIFEELS